MKYTTRDAVCHLELFFYYTAFILSVPYTQYKSIAIDPLPAPEDARGIPFLLSILQFFVLLISPKTRLKVIFTRIRTDQVFHDL